MAPWSFIRSSEAFNKIICVDRSRNIVHAKRTKIIQKRHTEWNLVWFGLFMCMRSRPLEFSYLAISTILFLKLPGYCRTLRRYFCYSFSSFVLCIFRDSRVSFLCYDIWPAKSCLRAYADSGGAVWSGPLLSANKIIGHYRMYQCRANAWMRLCTCVEWLWIGAFFAHARRHIFAWRGPFYHITFIRYFSEIGIAQIEEVSM